MNDKLIIIGENSRLTKSLKSIYSGNIFIVKKKLYVNWNSENSFLNFLDSFVINENDSILINKAIINPNFNLREINKWNFHFQKNIIKALERKKIKNRVYTTGSIFEKTNIENKYLNSKRNLSNYILQTDFNSVRPCHLRFHTLFGIDSPSENMFLGQIFNSIKKKTTFKMSHGNQLRQYHHYNEVSKHLLNVFSDSKSNNKIIEITGREWVKLIDIARSVFNYFDCDNLLKPGKIKSSNEEITDIKDTVLSTGNYSFSPALQKINNYLEQLLNEK